MLAATSNSAAAASGENSNMSPEEKTRTEMQTDSNHAHIALEDPATYLALKESNAQKLTDQFNSPVTKENKLTPDNATVIGPFVGLLLDEELDKTKYKSNFNSPTAEREVEVRTIETKEDFNNKYDNLAYFSREDKKVHMPKWELSEDVQNRLA